MDTVALIILLTSGAMAIWCGIHALRVASSLFEVAGMAVALLLALGIIWLSVLEITSEDPPVGELTPPVTPTRPPITEDDLTKIYILVQDDEHVNIERRLERLEGDR